jgi:hypothetical protein
MGYCMDTGVPDLLTTGEGVLETVLIVVIDGE